MMLLSADQNEYIFRANDKYIDRLLLALNFLHSMYQDAYFWLVFMLR